MTHRPLASLLLTAALPLSLALGACGSEPPAGNTEDRSGLSEPSVTTPTGAPIPTEPADAPAEAPPPDAPPVRPEHADRPALIPPAPGEEGGLPAGRTPLEEGDIEPGGAEDAAQVVQRYGAALEQDDFAAAHALWGDGGKASGMSAAEFADSMAQYEEIYVMTGAPGRPKGAAGSLYVTVPMQMYGRLQSGDTFNRIGPVTLRRVNDVPGSTGAQRRWHISDTDLKAKGTVRVEGE
ncbi:hypothetical protein [Pacificimonas flava]|uniref:Lipoprotein n=1 Tax=Pacificimonas flava TaxID=1234595 RepID=M2TQL5_9SPHN|nr:hypothetical protein [Pacificimonas flava]EMD84071.1 hypothetical protein C725_0001 [Pacificimonas flava]MBB5280051.1 hypothetical protein [Pacificimonas flava]